LSSKDLNPETIRAWRQRQGLDTKSLAALLAVSRITVDRWEQWNPKDPTKPKAKPTGPAESILLDLLRAEDKKTQAEFAKTAARISSMAEGTVLGVGGATLAGLAAISVPLAGLGLAGFALFQVLKNTWELTETCANPSCGKMVSASSKFCPECGTKRVDPMLPRD
jgi:DNA-binding transcriptional regulator YiaG